MNHRVPDIGRYLPFLILCCLAALGNGCARQSQPTIYAPPSRTYLVVQADTLNMRHCPDTTCPVIALLYKGETVAMRRSSGDWSEIERKQGQIGWVASRYLGGLPLGTEGGAASQAPAPPEEELASPPSVAPPDIAEELAQPGTSARPPAPPDISEEFGM